MLQVRNLVKRYVAKGETVTALNGVSLDFPERGMVFLLGKSGSGKSTLLNISGGLDEPDEGEVIVNGKSSKNFSKSDFDSYRNTYLGFIFQEYNILTELTVAENVALALELQGKPHDVERVAQLLAEVDLAGMGDRRPNTLSGGQKQRVAIARALVKDPEIIMADEPTGALDSKTGAQVFDTLKKLSASKLVIIVSHDREFAEVYADRIIELRDGNIISDVTRGEEIVHERKNLNTVSDKKISLLSGAEMSKEDEMRVVNFVRSHKGGVVISAEEEDLKNLPEERVSQYSFVEHTPEEVPVPADTCQFIRSKFPFRYALKMGLSGLKAKPLRLIFTTLLATVAFIVFGVFSTLITYQTAKVGADTLGDSYYQAAVLEKHGALYIESASGTRIEEIDTGLSRSHFSPQEVENFLAANPGFVPAYTLEIVDISFWSGAVGSLTVTSDPYYGPQSSFTAFADASDLPDEFTLHGRMPADRQECLISSMVFEMFRHYGYGSYSDPDPIGTYEDLLGKTLSIRHNTSVIGSDDYKSSIVLTIVGVVETGEDFSHYEALAAGQAASGMSASEWNDFEDEFSSVYEYSMSSLCWVGEGFYDYYKPTNTQFYYITNLSNDVGDFIRYNEGSEFKSDFLLKDENGEFETQSWGFGRPGASWTYYLVNPDADPEGSYIEFFFAPLSSNREGKISSVFSYDYRVDGELGYFYKAPYDFMISIRQSEKDFGRIFGVLGAVAVVLAIFAALLLFNFISASINAKKKDIGILRAVGATGFDVYKIFMVEGIAITLLCFALGCTLSYVACLVANNILMAQGIFTFRMFLFDMVNVLIVFAIAFVTAVVSTTVPVALTVKKKPVEAIRSI